MTALGRLLTLMVTMLVLGSLAGCTQHSEVPQGGQVKVVGNATCPVSGKPVAGSPGNPTFYTDFEGFRIGFMCPVCKGTFDKAPAAEKRRLLKVAQGKP